jgi:uncharacterized protein (TIGR02001 family)
MSASDPRAARPAARRLRERLRLGCLAAAAALAVGLGAAAPASAQVDLGAGLSITGSAAATTDYLFRGISQTRNRGALQGTLELDHESGLYIGTFLSTATFAGTDNRQELDIFGGFRFETGPVKWDTYVIGYTYPGYDARPGQFELSYMEVGARATVDLGSDVSLTAALNYSPNFFGRSGPGVYIEGGADWKIPGIDVTLSGRLGYQFIDRYQRFGIANDGYLWYGVTLSRDIYAGLSASVGFYGTDLSERECGGLKICATRFVGTLTWKF